MGMVWKGMTWIGDNMDVPSIYLDSWIGDGEDVGLTALPPRKVLRWKAGEGGLWTRIRDAIDSFLFWISRKKTMIVSEKQGAI